MEQVGIYAKDMGEAGDGQCYECCYRPIDCAGGLKAPFRGVATFFRLYLHVCVFRVSPVEDVNS
jgi:hypothetical protein